MTFPFRFILGSGNCYREFFFYGSTPLLTQGLRQPVQTTKVSSTRKEKKNMPALTLSSSRKYTEREGGCMSQQKER